MNISPATKRTRGVWFGIWLLWGAVVVLGTLIVGVLVLVAGTFVAWRLGRVSPSARLERLAAITGAGLTLTGIGGLHIDDPPACPEGPVTLSPGSGPFSCGGVDPVPWMLTGGVLVLVGLVTYAFAARKHRQSSEPPAAGGAGVDRAGSQPHPL